MGSYPVPIKSPSVLRAEVPPIVFQCYKSAWVLFIGLALALNSILRGSGFAFTWWAVASAAAWVPGGLCTISAVPRLGVGMTMVVVTGTVSVQSFLLGWFFLGERMKAYDLPGGLSYFKAPAYLVGTIAGMAFLVAVQDRKTKPTMSRFTDLSRFTDYTSLVRESSKEEKPSPFGDWALGLGLSVLSGTLAALQNAIVAIGRDVSQNASGCHIALGTCPVLVAERFNVFGSWTASFGIGAALVTAAVFALVSAFQVWTGSSMLDLHFQTLKVSGSLAGVSWTLGMIFQTAAVMSGGLAVMMPVNSTFQLLTSGMWGLLYYREVQDVHRALLWCGAAAWTVACAVLLSRERVV